MNKDLEYTLNFVIPQGEKGETGPTGERGLEGNLGPIGPSCLEALFFTEFAARLKTGNLNIGQNIILPENTNKFEIQGDYRIKVNEPGLYEVTLSGELINLVLNEQISILLQNETSTLNNISFNITSACNTTFFSQTFIHQFDSAQILHVLFQKDDNNISSLESSSIIIKKLSL